MKWGTLGAMAGAAVVLQSFFAASAGAALLPAMVGVGPNALLLMSGIGMMAGALVGCVTGRVFNAITFDAFSGKHEREFSEDPQIAYTQRRLSHRKGHHVSAGEAQELMRRLEEKQEHQSFVDSLTPSSDVGRGF